MDKNSNLLLIFQRHIYKYIGSISIYTDTYTIWRRRKINTTRCEIEEQKKVVHIKSKKKVISKTIGVILVLWYLILQILDIFSTFMALNLGAIEVNPLGFNYLTIGMKFFSVILILTGYYLSLDAEIYGAVLFISSLLIPLILFYTLIVINNFTVIQYLS